MARQLGETLRLHEGLDRKAAEARAVEMLDLVGIPEPRRRVRNYPHQLSGGMRQRVMIAIALACNPKLLIADEPTTALDVTIQAQILELMADLKRRTGTAIILITHDLGVVAEFAQRVMVMYAGRKVEEAPVVELFRTPRHPYTQGLIGAVPKLGSSLEGEATRLAEIPGIVPSLKQRIEGCVFAGRCPRATEICRQVAPMLESEGARPCRRLPPRAETGARRMSLPLLAVNDLKKHFAVRGSRRGGAAGFVRAVDGVSFEIARGETLSLVGESGLRQIDGRARRAQAQRHHGGRDRARRASASTIFRPPLSARCRQRMQVVFQDPFSSLNPRLRIKDTLAEPIRNFGLANSPLEIEKQVAELLDTVTLAARRGKPLPA